MSCPTCLLILGVFGFACALKACRILRPKLVGLPEPVGMVFTITRGARWENYDSQLEMAALSRLGIGYDELLDVLSQQVVTWVVPWVAPPVGLDCAMHRCGGPPAVRV